jgi:hypothetical protein
MCHISPRFICFTDPMFPLKCDMCHPLQGPCVMSTLSHVTSSTCLLGPFSGWSDWDPPVLASMLSTSPHERVTLTESETLGL